MGQEKMVILNMIKDGSITVDDGVKLLRALNIPNKSNLLNPFSSALPAHNIEKVKEQVKGHTNNVIQKTKNTIDTISEYLNDITSDKNIDKNIKNTEYFNKNFN